MIILSAFNKGGVGKTTLAVHVAGLLAEQGRVLLIDCVDQYDAFYFFCRQEPKQENYPCKYNERLTLIWNPSQSRVKSFIDTDEYRHIVLDINSPNEDTVTAILESEPELILLPINDQALALDRLEDTLPVVAGMEKKAGYQNQVKIIPLGVTKTQINERLSQITDKPKNLEMSKRINKHPKEFSQALQAGKFVWDYKGCNYIRDILQDAINR